MQIFVSSCFINADFQGILGRTLVATFSKEVKNKNQTEKQKTFDCSHLPINPSVLLKLLEGKKMQQ